jgi:hypothetical protein
VRDISLHVLPVRVEMEAPVSIHNQRAALRVFVWRDSLVSLAKHKSMNAHPILAGTEALVLIVYAASNAHAQ